ncbi:MAG: hypothetical protein LBU33_00560 [Endomicrobium sp.]|jgi:hypothetical protein|nr:hypothetical protein [Endomicrobium sp.]
MILPFYQTKTILKRTESNYFKSFKGIINDEDKEDIELEIRDTGKKYAEFS